MKADLCRDPEHEAPEVRGLHARVATELIHLVGRSLDQQRCVRRVGFSHRALDHLRMRRAQGIDPGGLPAFMARYDVEQHLHAAGDSSGCNASSNAATMASAIAATLKGPGTTPASASESPAVSNGAPAFTIGETMMALPYRK